MMLNETKEKIEDTFSLKVIGSFLKVLNKCSENKIGIPDDDIANASTFLSILKS